MSDAQILSCPPPAWKNKLKVSAKRPGRFHSTGLPNLWVDVAWLHPKHLPNPQFDLAAIMITLNDLPAQDAYRALYEFLQAA